MHFNEHLDEIPTSSVDSQRHGPAASEALIKLAQSLFLRSSLVAHTCIACLEQLLLCLAWPTSTCSTFLQRLPTRRLWQMMFLGVQRFWTSRETFWPLRTRTCRCLPEAGQSKRRGLPERSGRVSSALVNWVTRAVSPCEKPRLASRQFSGRATRHACGAA